ncbi:MAG TPA: tRNA glutamyl-Q(34) synthetase GluQRS [Ktedonobacterales bacterium]|nr:tRNA glutamyl-Q(34) synthetase GluQRS [Ktedonobacterales bacterium]
MSRGYRGRFAPSPTGALHLGNLRTALLAWLFARGSGGSFILRLEDLDRPRVRPGAAQQLLDDLRWLGLDWDEGPDVGGPLGPYAQSQRDAIYLGALARLRRQGLLYPCYCTRAELARVASAPRGAADDGPRYPGTCRQLTRGQRREQEASGRRPALRFRAPATAITFADRVAGPVLERVDEAVGDFVVRRSDGVIAYQLAVVVDDALMGVTQIVRGADLLGSTARQLALCDALGYARPLEFAHVPLALGANGERLAKRDQAAGIAQARARGVTATTIVGALAASCDLWPAGQPATAHEVLATHMSGHGIFDASHLTRLATEIVV